MWWFRITLKVDRTAGAGQRWYSSIKMNARVAFVWLSIIVVCVVPVLGQDLLSDFEEFANNLLEGIAWAISDISTCLQINRGIDFESLETRHFVLSHVDRAHEGRYNIAQVCDVWDYCAPPRWRYFSDPIGLSFTFNYTPASASIALGLRGDCDDFAVLIAAVVRSLGGTAIVQEERTLKDAHAYASVFIGQDSESAMLNLLYVLARYDLTLGDVLSGEVGIWLHSEWGYWLNLDWTATHPGGPYWASADAILESHYFPTPSLLWIVPIREAPLNTMNLLRSEFSLEELEAILAGS